jgi:hypothetical protein
MSKLAPSLHVCGWHAGIAMNFLIMKRHEALVVPAYGSGAKY